MEEPLTLCLLGMGLEEQIAEEIASSILYFLKKGNPVSLQRIHKILERYDLSSHWNQVLDQDRAKFVSFLVVPHIFGSCLDLCAGTMTVTAELQKLGVLITATEREQAYPKTRFPTVPQTQFQEIQAGKKQFDTVLVLAQLHHEVKPNAILRLSYQLAKKRVIIIENCIEPQFPKFFHYLIDIFFNRVLNKFDVPITDQVKTADEWKSLFRNYFKIVGEERKEGIPGIPLSYSLFVLEPR